MPGEGKERFYTILNIGLLLGASFSLLIFLSIKDQFASQIEFPEQRDTLLYDPLVHHFGFSDVWKIAQRFVTNEPPTTQGGGVIQDPIRDPDKLRVPDPPVRKPPHDGRTPSIFDTPAPTFRRHGHESPPKLSGDDLSSARDSHHPEGDQPDKNQTGANKGDPAKFFAYLNNLSFDETLWAREMKITKLNFNGTTLFAFTWIRYLGAQGVENLFTFYLEPIPSAKIFAPVGYNEGSPISNGEMRDVPMDKFNWLKSTIPTVITDRPKKLGE